MPIWIIAAMLVVAATTAAAAEAPRVSDLLELVVRAPDPSAAGQALVTRYGLTPVQVERVLALELATLSGLDDAGLARLLATAVPSGDQALLDLATKRVRAAEGLVLPTGPGEAGHLSGAVRFELEQVVIDAERIDFELAPIPHGRAFLEHATLLPGGELPRVRLDTRGSRFESLDFRGLLTPETMTVRRRESAPETAQLVFDLELGGLGAFAGLLRDAEDRWTPVSGSAPRMTMVLVADLVAGRVAAPRIRDLRLLGSPQAAASITIEEARQVVTVRSTEITLQFDPDGGLQRVAGGRDSEVTGRPPGADLPPAAPE